MANDLLRLAWKAPIKKGPKMVLVALADSANKAGECWPSRAALALKAECATSTVSRHIQVLVSMGVVEQVRRRRKSAVYRIVRQQLEALQDVSDPHILMSDSSGQDVPNQDVSKEDISNQDVSLATVKTSQTETFLKGTLIEPSIDTPSRKTRGHSYTPEFEQWWLLYPKRDGSRGSKFEASKSWAKALKVVPLETLMSAVRAYASSKRVLVGYAKDAPTWLNQRMWEDVDLDPAVADPTDWLRGEWEAGRVKHIEERTGLRYPQPDLPNHIVDRGDIENWLRGQARQWIATNRADITARLQQRTSA